MVLGQSLTDADGTAHAMAGLLGASFSFAKRKMNLGYRDVTLAGDCCLGVEGTRLRGHEFHYATIAEGSVPDAPLVSARDAQGNPPKPAGSRRGRVTGSFFHVVAAA
jgi:cobyrinic acid a,c-diamide synthase